ncbi:LRR receptor kinase SERK2 isoform X2 [Nicotiana sylvestris]|uniref:LRR receptor kinase SERK2 isoform X2 n=1 Tax=Nicotiana sylvestris TaxID=4096 RepID=UPI00388C971F
MGANYFLLTLFPLFLAFSCTIKPTNGNAEVRALMEIKSTLDSENKKLFSWTSNGDPCSGSFLGVFCNEHHKIANISLQGKGLTGKLSPAMAELKCLSGLYLHYNLLSGEIPKELGNLTELTDLYLNDNNLSGTIPPEIGRMASLQGIQGMLKRLYLGFNQLSGPIPSKLATAPQLEVLEIQNNTLTGVVPPALRRLSGKFNYESNPGLCGTGFASLRVCTAWDNVNVNQVDPNEPNSNNNGVPKDVPETANVSRLHCNQTHCSRSSRFPQVIIVASVITVTVTLIVAVVFGIFRRRRFKQRVGNTSDASDDRLSTDQTKEIYKRSPSPLLTVEYSNHWDPMTPEKGYGSMRYEFLHGFKFNLEEVESATQHFTEVNLLGRSNFSAVYKGILKDGSIVAVKMISVTSCKSEETEFMEGLSLLTSLKHENLVKLRGFCCSKGRGECFLIYDFASKGNLSQFLDVEENSSHVLDWSTRVSIIKGIAKGLGYLHSSEPNKPSMVHRNISVEKVLLDQQFTPLILDCGLLKLLADDVVYSALKVSAALGYMAPEYITTGRFTEKSDVYAFGVIILQVLSGKGLLDCSMRLAAESCNFENFIDPNLKGTFSVSEATLLTKLATSCTLEDPDSRPSMVSVNEELNRSSGG